VLPVVAGSLDYVCAIGSVLLSDGVCAYTRTATNHYG
jgi:hypothetical protein